MKRIICTILATIILTVAKATIYYIATNGSDSNPGTILLPFLTFNKINSLTLNPGDIIYIRAGTYPSPPPIDPSFGGDVEWYLTGKNGSSGNPIIISAYPPDFPLGGRIIFDCSNRVHTRDTDGALITNCTWIVFRGIRITGIPQAPTENFCFGWQFVNCNNIVIDNCEVDLMGSGGWRLDNISNSLFLNCDSHDNDNPFNTGIQQHGGADGFSNVGVGNNSTNVIFRGCRTWHNADDGYDLNHSNGTFTWDSCWTFWNGYYTGGSGYFTPGGDGSGVKFNLTSTNTTATVTRFVTNSLAVGNRGAGYDQSDGQFKAQFYNNISYKNLGSGWKFGYQRPIGHILRNNISYQNGNDDYSGDGVDWVQSNNSWNNIPASNASFQSIDTAGLAGPRQANGSLPNLTFLHLASNSNLINRGVFVGLPFCGAAPDLGPYEYCPGVPPIPLSATANNTLITCFGGTSTLTVNAAGGTPPYQYKLAAGAFSSTNSFTVSAGTYLLTVRDALGVQATTNATITQPSQITISQISGTITVNGNTTTTTVTASGGTGASSNYLYLLDARGYQTSNVFLNVPAGNHTITVRDSVGCTNTLTYTLTQPTALIVGSSVTTAITCNGGSGVITVTASGGTSPYTNTGAFSRAAGTWSFTVTDAGGASATTTTTITQPSAIAITESHTAITINGGTSTVTITASGGTGTKNYKIGAGSYQVSNVFSGVVAGTYVVTVRDANLCTNTITFTITQPTALLVSAATTTAIACNNGTGTATVTASGGTPSYQYKVGAGSYQASNVFSGLVAGTYTFTVLDAGGAIVSSLPLTITQPTAITFTTSFGTAPATVTVTASGGVGTLNYKLDAGSYQASNVFNSVAAGNHTITVRDANLCTTAQVINVPTAGTPLAITATPTNATCNGGNGSVNVSGSGGTAPYTGTGVFARAAGTWSFTITDNVGATKSTTVTITEPAAISIAAPSYAAIAVNGGSTTVTFTPSGGVPAYTYNLDAGGYQGSASFAGVLAGNHTITIKDANNCTSTLLFTITQPGLLYITVSPTAITCYGGNSTVTITGSGGTAPIAVTGGSPQTKTAGTYTFTVTDALGAVHDTIVTISQPTQISIAVTTGTILTNGGNTTVTATASGGTGSLQYKIDGGSYQGTGSFTGVLAGTHIVTVKDANNCTNTNTFSISQPGALYISATPALSSLVCYGNTTTVTVTSSGGTPTITYGKNGVFQGSGTFSNVAAGTYTFSVKDAFNAQHDTLLTITQPTQVAINAVQTGVISTPGGNTTALIIARGGTGSLQYSIDGGSYQADSSFSGLTGGNHTATVKDASNCVSSVFQFNIYQPPTQYYYKKFRREKIRYIQN